MKAYFNIFQEIVVEAEGVAEEMALERFIESYEGWPVVEKRKACRSSGESQPAYFVLTSVKPKEIEVYE